MLSIIERIQSIIDSIMVQVLLNGGQVFLTVMQGSTDLLPREINGTESSPGVSLTDLFAARGEGTCMCGVRQ